MRSFADLGASSKARNDWGTIRALLPFLWPARRKDLRFRVVGSVILLLIANGISVCVPILYKMAVDAVSDPVLALAAVPVGLLLAYGVTRVVAQTCGELRDAIFARVSQHAIRTVALSVFRHLHHLALRFHLDRQTGGINRAIERGTKGIDFLLNFMLFNILPTLVEILLICGILWWLYGAAFSLVTFVTIAVYIGFTLWVTEWRIKYRRAMNIMDSEANTKAIDSLLNYETVKYFGNENHEARRYDLSLRRYEDAAIKNRVTLSFLNIGQGVIIAVGLISVMIMAAYGVAERGMTVGDFVLVNSYLIQLYLPLNFLGFVYREIKQSLTDMEAMFCLLDEEAEIGDSPQARPLAVNGGRVSFRDVVFGYSPDRPILQGISFDVPAGKTVAIVGPSGAGKSTLSRLLFRFYDVDGGNIAIDDQDIRTVTQASLRAAIGVVPQDTVLFNDTIFYNIAYGCPDASKEDVTTAAKLARIDAFVHSLPTGYETTVGERGLKLSGGERQRVAIARTILKQPAILLFDEATSALDTHTEREIQDSLREVSHGHTTIIIAHRLSTVIDADEILVLDKGKIVEKGRHADLLGMKGRYADMWRKQQEAALLQRKLDVALAEAVAPDDQNS